MGMAPKKLKLDPEGRRLVKNRKAREVRAFNKKKEEEMAQKAPVVKTPQPGKRYSSKT
jgi:hypothetical protein